MRQHNARAGAEYGTAKSRAVADTQQLTAQFFTSVKNATNIIHDSSVWDTGKQLKPSSRSGSFGLVCRFAPSPPPCCFFIIAAVVVGRTENQREI